MTPRTYIDCSAMIGRRGPKEPETEYRTEVLLEEMAWCGIHAALIAHWTSKEYDPSFGNRLLLNELKKSGRLYGVWTVMPSHTGEFPSARDCVREMLDNGIRAAKMYPRTHHYWFNEDVCGDLFAEFEKQGILLIVEGGYMYGPELIEKSNEVLLTELNTVLHNHAGLNVLLQGARWEATRYLHALMKKHTSLHIELSNHQGSRAFETFTGWFGSDRILFGTGALDKSPGAAKTFLDYALLPEGDKENITSRNISRLLRLESNPGGYPGQPAADPILENTKAAKPHTDILIIDAHAHINHDDAKGVGFMHQPNSDAAGMHERARLIGIRKICISSWLGIWSDYEEGNKIVAEAMKRYPGFYHGYATLQPQYITDWEKELEQVYRVMGMEGIKPYHPRTDIPYNDKLWAPWFRYGDRMHAYALMHPSPDFTPEINDLAPRYPNISFIIAHTGGSFATARQGIEAARKFPNVYLEITLTSVTYRVIEYMVREIGADRVLFGTDQPMRDPLPQFGWVAYAHCSYEDKKKILGENMMKIINKVRRL